MDWFMGYPHEVLSEAVPEPELEPEPEPVPEEQDLFLARVLAGATRTELKAEFNISADILYHRLKRLKARGIAVPPTEQRTYPSDKREAILAKADAGMPAKDIAKELGLSKGAVAGVLARARQAGRLSPTVRKPPQPKAPPQPKPFKPMSTAAIEERLRWKETMVNGCRWIEGDLPWEWHWCGAPLVSIDAPYCAAHYARIHGVGKKERVDN